MLPVGYKKQLRYVHSPDLETLRYQIKKLIFGHKAGPGVLITDFCQAQCPDLMMKTLYITQSTVRMSL